MPTFKNNKDNLTQITGAHLDDTAMGKRSTLYYKSTHFTISPITPPPLPCQPELIRYVTMRMSVRACLYMQIDQR